MLRGDYFPKLPTSTVVLFEGEDKVLFLIPEKPDYITVNKNTAFLLSLCNGNNSMNDIRNIIAPHPFASEGMKLLETLINNDFFESKIITNNNKTILGNIHLNMTDICNLKCAYCYAEEREKSKVYMSLNDYFKVIDDAYQINNNISITFTGGEPLLNRHTIDVANYCKLKNIDTFILTNGTLINEENAKTIAASFNQIRISVDGNSENIHDRLRGHGSYRNAINAISLLEKYGNIPMIATTVTNINIHEIQNLALRYGNRLTFQPLYKMGRAHNSELSLDAITYYNTLKECSGVEPYGQLARRIATMRNNGCEKCAMGDGEISISPSGDVYPCHMLHDKKFLAGNIKNQNLQEIYYFSDVLNYIRRLSVNNRIGCQECPIRLLCSGGCWARAFHAHGDLNSSSDFCDYELSAFKHGLFTQAEL